MSYLTKARTVLADRAGHRLIGNKLTKGTQGERSELSEKSHDAAVTGRAASKLSEKRVDALRRTLTASPDLRVLLGLDPPAQPDPHSPCAVCGLPALPRHPLLTFLDGHRAHGWCPPARARAKFRKGKR